MEWILTISVILLILYLLGAANKAEQLHEQEKLERYIEEARMRQLDELYGRTSDMKSSSETDK